MFAKIKKVFKIFFVAILGAAISACGWFPQSQNYSSQTDGSILPTTTGFQNPVPTTGSVEVETNPTSEVLTSPTASSGLPSVLVCYTDSEILNNFGFQKGEVIRTDAPWDSCKWNRQTTDSVVTFTLPVGWGLTYTDEMGNVWVTVGKGQKVTARGFTLRQYGNQFLVDNFTYFQKEWDYGFAPERGTLTYAHCPDKDFYDLVVSKMSDEQKKACPVFFGVGAQETMAPVFPANGTATPIPATETLAPIQATASPVPPTSVPATSTSVMATATAVLPTETSVPATATSAPEPTASGQACPASTEAVASLVGGSANMWTPPDWSGGAWVFRSGGEFINLTVPNVPGFNTWIDYWNGSKGAADKLDSGQTLALNEASFHCHSK